MPLQEEQPTTYIIKTQNKSEMKQLIHAAEVYSLILEIDEYCRRIVKHDGKETRDEALEHIRSLICESEILQHFE